MRNLKYVSKQGSNIKPNEDKITILDGAAWVLDGATGITGKRVTDKETDALWYVEFINNYLKENIKSSKSLKEIMKCAIKEVKKSYSKFNGYKNLEKVDYPCAAIALVRFTERELEYFVLGDCTLILKEKGKNPVEIVNKKLIELEEYILNRMVKVAKENKISILEARKHCDDEVLKVRKKKNTSDGYWILELNEEAIDKALYGKILISEELDICLTSDGFSQYYDTFNLAKGYDEFINIVKSININDVYNNLYDSQEKDNECNLFPRLKKRDDSSIIFFTI
ncbi:protein phosphatase 2C domain-containing protein [Clostridium nigeriense]|uniref:protein phosphatase 2C domain-containing protein n=1 Tax=Clostridium nigeriense TaxID=1805470 RepID=UPI003D34B5EB